MRSMKNAVAVSASPRPRRSSSRIWSSADGPVLVSWGLVSSLLLAAAALNLIRVVVLWGDQDAVVERTIITVVLLVSSVVCAWRERLLSPGRGPHPGPSLSRRQCAKV